MDSIYKPEVFNASEKIKLGEYFQDFIACDSNLSTPIARKQKRPESTYIQKIFENVGVSISSAKIKELASKCSVEHLTCDDENMSLPMEPDTSMKRFEQIDFVHPITEKAKNFNCVQATMMLNFGSGPLERMFPTHSYLDATMRGNEVKVPTSSKNPAKSDFVAIVFIYKPRKFNLERSPYYKLLFSHSIEVLGSNTLAQFRDVIKCSSDDLVCKEVSSTKDDISHLLNAKNHYPSGFFFIENIFYNDFRHPQAIDYSEVIMKWAKDKKIEPLSTSTMDSTKFSDLNIRLGYPYLYMHQGECEHIMVFCDVRIILSGSYSPENYPYISSVSSKSCHQNCHLCCRRMAQWLCTESDRLPQDKTLLCTECCNSYNYINGEKVGSFKLYPFVADPTTDKLNTDD